MVAARMLAVAASLKLSGKRPLIIGHGGSSSIGTIGYVEAALELVEQIRAGAMPRPDAIYVALGSGGTAVGLALGLAAAELPIEVRAVRVTDWRIGNRAVLRGLMYRTIRRLRRDDQTFPDVLRAGMRLLHIDSSQREGGYGTPNDAGLKAIVIGNEDGLVLDPTYTAKTFAALLDAAPQQQNRRLLYWHTLSSVDLDPLVATAPPLPEWVRRE